MVSATRRHPAAEAEETAAEAAAANPTPMIGRLPDTAAYARRGGFAIMNPVGW